MDQWFFDMVLDQHVRRRLYPQLSNDDVGSTRHSIKAAPQRFDLQDLMRRSGAQRTDRSAGRPGEAVSREFDIRDYLCRSGARQAAHSQMAPRARSTEPTQAQKANIARQANARPFLSDRHDGPPTAPRSIREGERWEPRPGQLPTPNHVTIDHGYGIPSSTSYRPYLPGAGSGPFGCQGPHQIAYGPPPGPFRLQMG